MKALDGLQDPYQATLKFSNSEHHKLYNQAIFGIPESDRYDLTRSKCTGFYQELDDDVFIFGFRAKVFIMIDIYAIHESNEVKNIILSHPYITKVMVNSHCEILWNDNSGEGLVCHSTENYGASEKNAANQDIIT